MKIIFLYPRKFLKKQRLSFWQYFERELKARTPHLTRGITEKSTFYCKLLPDISEINEEISKDIPGFKVFDVKKVEGKDNQVHTQVERNPEALIECTDKFIRITIQNAVKDDQ